MENRPTDQKQRNKLARHEIVKVVEQNGLRWNFVAKNLQMDQSNLSHWRKERFEFGVERLKAIESFIDRYNDAA